MKKLLMCAVLAFNASAYAAVPTDASLKELLQITDSQKMMDQSFGQIDQYMKMGMQEAFKGKEMTPEIQKKMDDTSLKIAAVFKEEFSWESFEPIFIEIYRKSFTQSDVDGMLQFYKTEAGQSVIKKMPLVMQNTMELTQQRMKDVMPKIMQIAEESMKDIEKGEAVKK
jgi:hypothetical protein